MKSFDTSQGAKSVLTCVTIYPHLRSIYFVLLEAFFKVGTFNNTSFLGETPVKKGLSCKDSVSISILSFALCGVFSTVSSVGIDTLTVPLTTI